MSEKSPPAQQMISNCLEEIRRCIAPQGRKAAAPVDTRRIDELVTEIGARVESERKKAQDAVNSLVRVQTAQGLAPLFLERRHPYTENAQLAAMIEDGLLHRATFIQKLPHHLQFYRWLLRGMDPAPRSILEIGVKGGGSTAFWKALFPDATVVGLDIKLRRWLKSEPSEDGVIYVEGDQTDVALLRKIATQYGPFDVVIDDGSHVGEHQAITLRSLLPRVQPGGYYVVEDTQTTVKSSSTRAVDYGEDIWADFTLAVLQRLRTGPLPPTTPGSQLGFDLVRRIDDLIIGHQVLAIRARTPEASSSL